MMQNKISRKTILGITYNLMSSSGGCGTGGTLATHFLLLVSYTPHRHRRMSASEARRSNVVARAGSLPWHSGRPGPRGSRKMAVVVDDIWVSPYHTRWRTHTPPPIQPDQKVQNILPKGGHRLTCLWSISLTPLFTCDLLCKIYLCITTCFGYIRQPQ